MRSLLLLLVAVSGTLALAKDQLEVDIDSILADPQKEESLYNCVMDKSSCSLDESLVRALIRGAFVLSDDIPLYIMKYVRYLVDKDEERFFELAGKYDREDGIFKKLYYNRKLKCSA